MSIRTPDVNFPLSTFNYPFIAFSIFAHESRRVTVRLKTSLPSVESGSTQK